MSGLPKSTMMKKQIPKSAIYKKYGMDSKAREKFDNDISRIYIVNEVSTRTMIIERGLEIDSFFVVQIMLKNKKYDESNIIKITKLINQNMIFELRYEDKKSFAVYRGKLITSDWRDDESEPMKIQGLTLDEVWKQLIIQIGDIHVEPQNTLDEQIQVNDMKEKILANIKSLDRKARSERQPRKKFEMVEKINELKKELGEL
ncbi:DUF4391 domain-containing protein [Vallitalea pronyensis]|uniref:DUF4391 domain-containing protein n=1 Tax=Vallitalea pronyensis TaxID=1348613 RepID=A0A8J8MJX8_9FIRM|nr:DUF4391 domain-containing protein [Vallitalea pronyensis]QUI23192.1 DUF4391 domain-containing protein [Vallitalea pronyensis]